MKKIFSNNRLIAIAFFTVFSVMAAPFAAVASDSTQNRAMPVVELKQVGNINDQPIFQLTYSGNTQQDEFTIVIRDANGNSLYRETIKAENFTKKFLFNKEEISDEKLRFEISSKNQNKTVVYEVNRNIRQVEDLVISKL
jgi:hypothetical protein